jgi:hypothetical protein
MNSRVTTYRSNNHPGIAIRGRAAYYSLRQSMRQIRRNSPRHMDVLYYEQSLSLFPYSVAVCHVTDGGFNRLFLNVGITGPVGKLP